MSVLALIQLIVDAVIVSGFVYTILFFRSRRLKEQGEAQQAKNEAESIAIANLEKAIEVLAERESKLAEFHNIDVETIERMHSMINDLNNDLILCQSAICANDLCPLRSPARGLGKAYFEENKQQLFNGDDFKEICSKKGYTITQNTEN